MASTPQIRTSINKKVFQPVVDDLRLLAGPTAKSDNELIAKSLFHTWFFFLYKVKDGKTPYDLLLETLKWDDLHYMNTFFIQYAFLLEVGLPEKKESPANLTPSAEPLPVYLEKQG